MNTIENTIAIAGRLRPGRAVAGIWFKLGLWLVLAGLAGIAGAQPANDNFTNAAPIGGLSGTTNGSNVGATLETNEPVSVDTTDYGEEPVASSVWYQWTAPASEVTFNTLGSSFDTLLAVYTNNAGSVTLTNLGLVTAEDDIGGNAGWVYQSQVGFSAVSNTAYYLSVNTSVEGLDNTGSVVLNWFSASANTNVPTIPSGTFFFTSPTYTVSDSDESSPINVPMDVVPPWLGARVTVTRTNGSSGRVLVPYTVTGDSNQPWPPPAAHWFLTTTR